MRRLRNTATSNMVMVHSANAGERAVPIKQFYVLDKIEKYYSRIQEKS